MTKLRKMGRRRYHVLVEGKTVGQVWCWQGEWVAATDGKSYFGHKRRKQAVERIHELKLHSKN